MVKLDVIYEPHERKAREISADGYSLFLSNSFLITVIIICPSQRYRWFITVVPLKVIFFFTVTSCSVVEIYQRFGGIYCFHFRVINGSVRHQVCPLFFLTLHASLSCLYFKIFSESDSITIQGRYLSTHISVMSSRK